MARRISVMNHKGGVGKTTASVNLAVCLATRGHRTLLVDFDPQANASQFLGLAQRITEPGVYGSGELTARRGDFSPLRGHLHANLDLVPATEVLFDVEKELVLAYERSLRRLRQAITDIEAQYDFIVVDCPPTLGFLPTSAAMACPEVIIPVRLAPASLPGALRMRAHLEDLRVAREPSIRILGVLGTYYSEVARTPREILAALKAIFDGRLFQTVIHQSQPVENAAGRGFPTVLLDPKSRAAAEYQQFTQEVIDRA